MFFRWTPIARTATSPSASALRLASSPTHPGARRAFCRHHAGGRHGRFHGAGGASRRCACGFFRFAPPADRIDLGRARGRDPSGLPGWRCSPPTSMARRSSRFVCTAGSGRCSPERVSAWFGASGWRLALLLAVLMPWPATRLLQLAAAAGLIGLIALIGHAGATPGTAGHIHLASDVVHLLAAGTGSAPCRRWPCC